jgi:hypothetical protein
MVAAADPRLKQIAQKLKQLRLDKGYSSYEAFAFDHELPRVGYGRQLVAIAGYPPSKLGGLFCRYDGAPGDCPCGPGRYDMTEN